MATKSGKTKIPAAPAQLTPRLAQLRTTVMAGQGAWNPAVNFSICDVAQWRAVRPGQSRVQRRAAFLLELVTLAPLRVGAVWRLAGEHLRPLQPKWLQDLSPADAALVKQAFNMDDAAFAAMTKAVKVWNGAEDALPGGPTDTEVGEATADSARGRGVWSTNDHQSRVYWSGGWIENHSIRDFAKVLRIGFGGIRAEIEAKLNALDLADP